MRGRFISVEGLDGTGKTTVCAALAERLRVEGVEVTELREPGGTVLGERIRGILADPAQSLTPRAELLLFSAARAELADTVIRPALESGTWVLVDRFADSTLAYQGAGRQLGEVVTEAAIVLATGGLLPDRTLLLRAPAAVRAERLAGRSASADRLEGEDEAFFARAEFRYDTLAEEEPGRVRPIDATGTPAAVTEAAWLHLEDLLLTTASG